MNTNTMLDELASKGKVSSLGQSESIIERYKDSSNILIDYLNREY